MTAATFTANANALIAALEALPGEITPAAETSQRADPVCAGGRMIRLHSVTIATDTDSIDAARSSFAALSVALEHISSSVRDGLGEDSLGVFVLPDKLGDLVACEPVGSSAAGARELKALKVAPGERYRELVAAVAGRVDGYAVGVVHGWPILSSVSGSPTIAEAGGESIASGGGPA